MTYQIFSHSRFPGVALCPRHRRFSACLLAGLAVPSLLMGGAAYGEMTYSQGRSPQALTQSLQQHPLAASLLLAEVPESVTFLSSINHGYNVNTVGFSNSGDYLASAGGDGLIRIWHLDSVFANDVEHYVHWAIGIPDSDRYVTSLAFSPDDRYLVTATFMGDVRVWDLQNCDPETNTCASNLLMERDYKSVAPVVKFSPNGQLLAASNYDGTVTIWNWPQQEQLAVLEPETGAHDGTRVDGRFSSISFSPDGQLLVAGSHDTKITVWQLEDFKRVGTIETGNGVDSVAFSPDSTWLASGNLYGVELRSMRVSRDRLRVDDMIQLEGNGRVNTLAFDPNGGFIYGGDNNNHIMVWDVEEEEILAIIPTEQQHQSPILTLAVNPIRRIVATGSSDGLIKLWQP